MTSELTRKFLIICNSIIIDTMIYFKKHKEIDQLKKSIIKIKFAYSQRACKKRNDLWLSELIPLKRKNDGLRCSSRLRSYEDAISRPVLASDLSYKQWERRRTDEERLALIHLLAKDTGPGLAYISRETRAWHVPSLPGTGRCLLMLLLNYFET